MRSFEDAGEISDLDEAYVRVAADELVCYSAPWTSSVVDAWRRTLTRSPAWGLDQIRRRVRRLLHADGLGRWRRLAEQVEVHAGRLF